MNRTWGRSLVAACTIVAIAVGCDSTGGTIYIGGEMLPPTSNNGSGCLYTPSSTGPFALEPVADIAAFLPTSSPTYTGVFLVANQMIETGNSSQVLVETDRVILNSAIVYVEDGQGQTISSFTRSVSGEIDPASGSTPSYSTVAILIVDGTAGDIIADQVLTQNANQTIVAKIQLKGTTLGGRNVESNVYEQNVTFCEGCLIELPPVGGCTSTSSSSSSTSVPCFYGQDQLMDCCVYTEIPWCTNQSLTPVSTDAGTD